MQGSSNSSLLGSPSMAPALVSAVPGADKPPARRIVASHRLPLRATPDPDSPFGFAFSLDPDALPLQLSRGLPAAVTFVGTLPAAVASAVAPSDEIDEYLTTTFSCLPVHLDRDCHAEFYDRFCKRYLWPHLHYLVPVASREDLCFNDEAYRFFVAANKRFADRVTEALSPDDGDLVVVHDYHLWLLPTFLRRRCPRGGVGFFLHSPFPSADVFRNIPVREDLLRALLNADLVGFHTFDYAGHFLASCSRVLGVSSRSRGGHIGVDYYGRAVLVKVISVGLDMARLRAAIASPEAAARVKEITDAYRGKRLVVGVDDVDRLKGVSRKLQAMENMLTKIPEMCGKVVLIQINNPARCHGDDVDGVRNDIDATRERINSSYGDAGYTPVVTIDGPIPMSEKVAYYAAADCCVVSAVRDGLNRIPYFYTVCREEGPSADDGGPAAAQQRTSAVVVSEFVGCSPSLGGAIRVNPLSADDLAQAMLAALTMRTEEKLSRHRRNYSFIAAHSVVTWARAFDANLRVASQGLSAMRFVSLGSGTGYRAVAFDAGFRKFAPEHAKPAYCAAASRRLIVLQYDGGMVPDALEERQMQPNARVIELLNDLCSDPKNIVFLFSGSGKDQLAEWFAPCEKLGIAAEHGYFTRWSRDDPWEASKVVVASGFAWKEIAGSVMKHYTESTDGSYIENTESGMVWNYENTDPSLGPWQARELFDHLESLLAREPAVSVTRGERRQTVEVMPRGLTDGAAVEALLSAMARRGDAPEFVLCMGDDESVFEALLDDDGKLPAGARVFTCTVGQAPSKAAFYLDEPQDVVAVLRGLLNICGHHSSRCLLPAAAAVPAARGPHSRRPSLFEIASAW